MSLCRELHWRSYFCDGPRYWMMGLHSGTPMLAIRAINLHKDGPYVRMVAARRDAEGRWAVRFLDGSYWVTLSDTSLDWVLVAAPGIVKPKEIT